MQVPCPVRILKLLKSSLEPAERGLEAIETNIQEAISLYIDTLREDGQAIPEPSVSGKLIAV